MQVDFVVVLVGAGMEMAGPKLSEYPEMVRYVKYLLQSKGQR